MTTKVRKTGNPMNRFEEIHRKLMGADVWVILAHERPDGDTIGCGSALARRAELLGKNWSWFGPDPVPGTYGFLYGTDRYCEGGSLPVADLPEGTVIVALDTSSADRTVPLEAARRSGFAILNIDHHGDNECFGDFNLLCPLAPAAAEILWDLYQHAGWEPDAHEAEALYAAIVTDTGHFRFEGTSGKTLRIAAELVERGVLPHHMFSLLYENRTLSGLHLWGQGFLRARTITGGEACITCLEQEDFNRTGAGREETEHLVNELLQLKGVRLAFLLIEEEGCVRVSIRTKEPHNARDLACLWDGGGHLRAAGCRIEGSLEDAARTIQRELEEKDGKRFPAS